MELSKHEEYRNPFTRNELKLRIEERARELRIKTYVSDQLKAAEHQYLAEEKARLQEKAKTDWSKQSLDGITNFEPDYTGKEYGNMYCGSWIATEDGVWSQESSRANQTACYHPILPIKRMRNMETGEEQITLAFKRGGVSGLWTEILVPKDMIANSRSITTLAKYGVSVTSETAKLLVRYLADVENYNDDKVILVQSSSKLGWHGSEFLPYDKKIVFDAELRFPQIINSIRKEGSYQTWMTHIKEIRAEKRLEPRLALAASFASVIVPFLNIASILIDFNGVTEAGKTVMHMLAASVWACPDEGQYIGDFLSTDTEMEVRGDVLNNLPLILDDTSKMNKTIRENIEKVVYNLSSGTGKKRSNKDLGTERVRTWKNAVIINGERPLSSFVDQAGAINRILEIDLTDVELFASPSATADLVRSNFGFAGPIFVEAIKKMDKADIREIHRKYCQRLTTSESMQKQVISLAAILTADDIATKEIFRDGNNLKPAEVAKYLVKRSLVEEGARCYEYLLGVYEEQAQHFDAVRYDNLEQWGEVVWVDDDKYINFNVVSLERIVKNGGFSRKAFTGWAKRKGLLRYNNDRDTFLIRTKGSVLRCISVKVVDLEEYDNEKTMFL